MATDTRRGMQESLVSVGWARITGRLAEREAALQREAEAIADVCELRLCSNGADIAQR
jgi:hypothetical protein